MWTYVVLLCNILHKGNDFKRCGRVKTGCGLVKEEELGARNELGSDTDTTLLTTRDTLADGRSNEIVGLARKTECGEQGFDTLDTLKLANGGRQGETCSEVEGFADCECAYEGVFLLDVCRHAAEGLGVGRRAVDVDGRLDRGVERGGAVSENVQERGLAGTTGEGLVGVTGRQHSEDGLTKDPSGRAARRP